LNKSQGYKAPATGTVNPDTGELTIGGGAETVDSSIVKLGTENNWQRFVQTYFSVSNIEELSSVPVNVSGSYTINPNLLGMWEINAFGADLTIAFDALTALGTVHQNSLFYGAIRNRTIEIIINWQTEGAHTLTITDALWGNDGDDPVVSSGVATDIVMVQVNSNGRILAFVTATGMA